MGLQFGVLRVNHNEELAQSLSDEPIQHPLDHWLAQNREHGFRAGEGERVKTLPPAGGQDHS
jgi:hypothetical protein